MEQELEEKQGKYSLVTGEKIKNKSIRKLKKEHKISKKEDAKQQKKLDKKKRKIEKRLVDPVPTVEATTISSTDLESQNMKTAVGEEVLKEKTLAKKTEQEKILIVRKAETGRPVTPKRKILNLLSYAMVGLVAVFFGYFAGNFYVANYLNKPNYNFSEAAIRDDGQVVYTTVTTSGKSILAHSAGELFVASEYKFDNQENYYTTVSGEIQPSIGSTQTVWGSKNKIGNNFEIESVSKGMLSVGEKYIYDTTTRTAKIYKASSIKSNKATYPSEDKPTWVMTYDDFRAEYGTAPDSPCIPYVISSKTVIEGSEKVVKEGNNYKLTFSLKTDMSVINYIKQVKHMSGLKDYPTFKKINVTAIINEDLEFSYLRFDESYTVMYFGVMATCSGFVEINVNY